MTTSTDSKIKKYKLKRPIGQALLHEGFKPITANGMFERFGARKLLEKMRDDFIEQNKEEYPYYKVAEVGITWLAMNIEQKLKKRIFGFIDWTDVELYKKIKLEIIELDSYIIKNIPDRCLLNIEKAKSLGVPDDKFFIAHPVMEDYLKDPIVFVAFDLNKINKWIEIDSWE